MESHFLMTVLQMLLRRSQKSVQTDEDYFTGSAHPVVFQPSELDALRMVLLAHELTIDKLPAMARIQVIEEDLGVPGRDYFQPHRNSPPTDVWSSAKTMPEPRPNFARSRTKPN